MLRHQLCNYKNNINNNNEINNKENLLLFQRISITMRRFNAILLHNCFVCDDSDI